MEEGKPVAVISLNDITALTNILLFYERYLASKGATKQLAEAQFLQVKVSMLDKSNIIVLTHEEVDCISSAIKAFISQVKTRIPQSKNRDEVIKNCEGLRDFIITVFAPKQA